jgi:hypothetical protein
MSGERGWGWSQWVRFVVIAIVSIAWGELAAVSRSAPPQQASAIDLRRAAARLSTRSRVKSSRL